MPLPTRDEAHILLKRHVTDSYLRFHGLMVGTALAGYARKFEEDVELWFLTGYLHDIDYEQFPHEHPGPSLRWFKEWDYPEALIQAVRAHANGFNGYTTPPVSLLDKTLVACDEICGIFYAYQKLNPIPFSEMKVSSIKKRLAEPRFAPGIDRTHIHEGVAALGITIDEHIQNLIGFLSEIKTQQ